MPDQNQKQELAKQADILGQVLASAKKHYVQNVEEKEKSHADHLLDTIETSNDDSHAT